jgi:hypothetical protein
MTMSSSIAAETATPSTASAVRADGAERAKARVAIMLSARRARAAACARAARREPAGDDAQHERERTAMRTMSPVTMEKRSGVRYTAW